MKVILVYNSKSGFTKRYADWIAEETDCDVKPYRDFEQMDIGAEDIVIFGSRVHAGRIEHLNKVKARMGRHPKQNFIVFATGATPAVAEDAVQKIWDSNFSETERQSIPHFYMQSGLDYQKMGFVDRMLMKMVAKLMSKKKGTLSQDKSDEETGFAQAIQDSYDISSKEYVMPLVTYVNEKAR